MDGVEALLTQDELQRSVEDWINEHGQLRRRNARRVPDLCPDVDVVHIRPWDDLVEEFGVCDEGVRRLSIPWLPPWLRLKEMNKWHCNSCGLVTYFDRETDLIQVCIGDGVSLYIDTCMIDYCIKMPRINDNVQIKSWEELKEEYDLTALGDLDLPENAYIKDFKTLICGKCGTIIGGTVKDGFVVKMKDGAKFQNISSLLIHIPGESYIRVYNEYEEQCDLENPDDDLVGYLDNIRMAS